MFALLARRGALDETVIVYMTDNGFSFGDHRHVEKTCPYDSCVRVPLWIRVPGRPGARPADLVSNVDVAPTIAELAGVEPPDATDGRSLVPALSGEAGRDRRDAVLLYGDGIEDEGLPAFWAVRTRSHKYVESESGERELYDLRADPWELRSVHRDREQAAVLRGLRNRLAALRREAPE